MPSHHPTLVSRLLAVGLPFFKSPQRGWALLALVILVVLLLAINGLNVLNSFVGAAFMSALAERHARQFYLMAAVLAGVFALSTITEVFASYVQQRLALFWRDWLTQRYLERFLTGRAYLQLNEVREIDNPDQRISEDIQTFTTTTLSFLVLLCNGLLTLIAFLGVLWTITPWLVLVALGYATAGSVGTLLLGHRLIKLNNWQLQKQADFRFGLGRVREHATAVAQHGGEKEERKRLGQRLAALVENFRQIIIVNRNLGFFTTAYGYLPQIIPVVLVAHLYIDGQVEFGKVTQSSMAFSQVLGAFSLVVSQFQSVFSYAVVITRLGSLWEAMEGTKALGRPGQAAPAAPAEIAPAAHSLLIASRSEAPRPVVRPAVETVADPGRLAYDHLTLETPEGRSLVRDLSLEVREGRNLMITGASGAGKTALLLATTGLWTRGQGRIIRPAEGVMFVPHWPYLAPGRLRELLHYGLPKEVPDEQLLSVLAEVGLESVVQRGLTLDSEEDWNTVCSLSEQQMLACARLLLAQPRFAFLDDVTRGLDPRCVERLYQNLARHGITSVSVTSQPALGAFHDCCLELLGDGKWRCRPLS